MPSRPESAVVYLVGAGPGDPELITVKGLKLLRLADTVVYDRLVHPDLLDYVRPDAARIFAGKSPEGHSYRQEDINGLLIEHARRGRIVVRLKGGDPFVFGRGGEECLALAAAGIRCEVVPGITSAVAVPGGVGIPLTHRQVSTGFAVVTGRTAYENDEPDWKALASIGTIVVLMGLQRLAEVAHSLIQAGRPSKTPVAVIASGTTNRQVAVFGTLSDISERARNLAPPATIVIGDVVALRDRIRPQDEPASALHGPALLRSIVVRST